MENHVLFARSFLASLCAVVLVSCGGGAGTAPTSVAPPAAAPIAANGLVDLGIPNTSPDAGTLLPLTALSVRAESVTPYAVTSCSSTAACIGGTNTSTGPGVAGVSSLGKGVTGTTTFASTTSTNAQYGVYGQDSSTSGTNDVGVYGLSVRGIGVSGKSTSGYGVRGTSATIAVYGVSSGNYGVYGSGPKRGVWGAGGPIGVYGNGTQQGVYGSSTAGGYGVYGSSPSYVAVYGTGLYGMYGAGTAIGMYGFSSSGIAGEFNSTSYYGVYGFSSSNSGVYATSSSGNALEAHAHAKIGALISNTAGNGIDSTGTYIGVIARAPANGFPFVATGPSGNNLFFVTGGGDVYYHGTLHTFARTSNGAQAQAFSPQTTRPAIEDTGSARLVDGRATVSLDPTFARTIDTARPYQVFVTPGGDTRGLYVASKSATEFTVREVQGGRGNFSFDYHIYATAFNRGAEHMAMAVEPHAPIVAAGAQPPQTVPVPPATPEP